MEENGFFMLKSHIFVIFSRLKVKDWAFFFILSQVFIIIEYNLKLLEHFAKSFEILIAFEKIILKVNSLGEIRSFNSLEFGEFVVPRPML